MRVPLLWGNAAPVRTRPNTDGSVMQKRQFMVSALILRMFAIRGTLALIQ